MTEKPIRHKASGLEATIIAEWAGWAWCYRDNGTHADMLFTIDADLTSSASEWEERAIVQHRAAVYAGNGCLGWSTCGATDDLPVGYLVLYTDNSVVWEPAE